MKNYHRAWLFVLFLIIYFFSPIPADAFSDNFNSGLGTWTIYTGSILEQSPSWDSSTYIIGGTNPAKMRASASGNSFFSADMEIKMYDASYGTFYFEQATTTDTGRYMQIGCTAPSVCSIFVGDVGYSQVFISIGVWYHVTVDQTGSNEIIIISYPQNGTIINQQVISNPAHVVSANQIQITTNGAFEFDNVVASSVSPTTSTSISWGSAEYTRDDTVSFTWVLTDAEWATYNRYFAKLEINGIIQDFSSFNIGCLCYSQLGIGTQTGSYSLIANQPGVYKVSLQKGTILYDEISNAKANIRDYSSAYILVNASNPYHTQIPITYNFGKGGINDNYAIQTYYLNPATNSYQFEHSFFGLSSSGTRNVFFEKVGTYIVKLRNVPSDITYDQKTTTTTYSAPDTVINISTSTLMTSKSSYYYGDTIFGNYTIDSVNWTAGQLYLDVFNWDKNVVTSEMQGSGAGWTDVSLQQIGDLLVNILNVPAGQNFPATSFISGNNALRLMLKNSTGYSKVLAFKNFTLTDLTASGYGLRLSKYSVLIDEKFYVFATVPENGAKLILVNTGTDSTKGWLLATIGVNQSPATIPVSISKEGNYAIILNNPSNNTEIMQNVEVRKSAGTPTPTPTTSTPSPEKSQHGVMNLIGGTAYIVIIVTIVFMGVGGVALGGVGLIVGLIVVVPILYIGNLIPLWAVFLDAGGVCIGLALIGSGYLTKNQ